MNIHLVMYRNLQKFLFYMEIYTAVKIILNLYSNKIKFMTSFGKYLQIIQRKLFDLDHLLANKMFLSHIFTHLSITIM